MNVNVRQVSRRLGLLAATWALAGCASTPKPIFEPLPKEVVWPPPPHLPRIRYVGELTQSADLKPPGRAHEVLALALGGKKAAQPLYGPRSVVATSDGQRVWIADPGGRCLHLFDLANRRYLKVTRVGKSQLLTPVGLALGPEGTIFVCDSESVAIHQLDGTSGAWLRTFDLPDELLRPVAACYNAPSHELFVLDVLGHDIKVLDDSGRLTRVLARRGAGPGELNFPSALTGDGQRLWIADTGNNRVQAITLSGEPVVAWGRAGDSPGDLAMPKSIAVDPDGNVYIVDGRFENVQIFDQKGTLLLFFGQEGHGPGEFWLPGGIFIEPSGRIWVCDAYNRRVQVFQYIRQSEALQP